jgi:hypothetical protein
LNALAIPRRVSFRVPRRVDSPISSMSMSMSSITHADRIIINSIPSTPNIQDIVRTVIHNSVGTMKRRRPDPLPTLQTGKIYKLPGERVHTTHTNRSKWLTRPELRRRKQSGSFTISPTRIILTPPPCHHTKTSLSTVNPASR